MCLTIRYNVIIKIIVRNTFLFQAIKTSNVHNLCEHHSLNWINKILISLKYIIMFELEIYFYFEYFEKPFDIPNF